MKKILCRVIMASSLLLCAFTDQSGSDQSTHFSFKELECRNPCRHPRRKCLDHENVLFQQTLVTPALAYGSFYTKETLIMDETEKVSEGKNALMDEAIILVGSPILFNQTDLATNSLRLQADGSILFTQPGTYQVKYGACTIPLEIFIGATEIALALNGVVIPGSDITLVTNRRLDTQSLMFSVPNAPATLTLINNGVENFGLATFIPETISAFITLKQLD